MKTFPALLAAITFAILGYSAAAIANETNVTTAQENLKNDKTLEKIQKKKSAPAKMQERTEEKKRAEDSKAKDTAP
jgi:hypothetical protein